MRTRPAFPILTLLHPRELTLPALLLLTLALTVSALGMRLEAWPLWVAAAVTLAILLIPCVAKWRADLRRYGWLAMGLSFMLITQGFHTVEHIAQWVQYHVLHWTMRASSGVLSPANAEWVHFVWNWLVVAAIVALVAGGLRNVWAWLLLTWAVVHALEHAYLFARYLQVLQELKRLGITGLTAQGLPGILGEGGWLAQSRATQGTLFCRLPVLTTAPRLDIHFGWNAGEMALLLLAAHTGLGPILGGRSQPGRKAS